MTKKLVRLGMLTPSSNTVLEPITSEIIANVDNVSVHFSRLKVVEISLKDFALDQFNIEPFMKAAHLLADARVDVIAWNGTSAGWLGFETDRKLCRAIQDEFGIPATTSTLALSDALKAIGATTIGLVTPYLDEIQNETISNFQKEGFDCVSEQHLRDPGNFSFSEITSEVIENMIREVALDDPQAIAIFCTNLRGAPLVAPLEKLLGVSIFDTVSVVVWKSLMLAGVDTRSIKGWGRLFEGEIV